MKNKLIVLVLAVIGSIDAYAQTEKLLWLKTFSPYSANANLAIDKQENIYIALNGYDSVDMDPGPNQYWVYSKKRFHGIAVGKYSKNGDLIWAGLFDGDIPEQGLSFSIDDDLNVYFTGRFEDTIDIDPSENDQLIHTSNELDFFVVKLNSTGGLVWFKQFGSIELDFITSSICDSKGNLYLTGNFRANMDFDPGAGNDLRVPSGSVDLFLIKLNHLGDYQWGLQYGDYQSSGNTVSLDPYENIVLSGQCGANSNFNPRGIAKTHTNYGNRDFFVARYNKNGELIHSFTGGGAQYDLGMAVTVTKNDGIYLFGNFRGTATFDPLNSSMDMTSVGSLAHFMARYDTTGKCLWRMQIPVTGSEFLYYNSILPDNNGNVYIVSDFNAKIDMDPSNDSLIFNTAGKGDIFIQKLDVESNLIWAKKIGGSNAEDIHGVCIDKSNNLILFGTFGDSALFELDSLPLMKRTEGNSRNQFLLKYGLVNSNSLLDVINSKISIYPNPSNQDFSISGLPENSTIKIYSSVGVELHQYQTKESGIRIDTSHFLNGNYLIVIHSNNVIYTRKLLINR